jgi:glyoxylase-like metal-dependent hydrolase (beta-lactamase superfamily II)
VIFRQLFDQTSGTYSYLLASRRGGEALIIDPVLEKVDRSIPLLQELDLKLVKAVDTHLHADHVTGPGELRDRTQCLRVRGNGLALMSSPCEWRKVTGSRANASRSLSGQGSRCRATSKAASLHGSGLRGR